MRTNNTSPLLLALGLLAFSAPLRAQGSDSCATPTVISGLATFPYVNAGMTTGAQGQGNMDCSQFGDTGIYRDVWFVWTAPTTDRFEITTCGLTSFNTKMAIYPGNGCPSGAPLMCNDDSYCGSAAVLLFNAVAGNQYTLQLGSSSSTSSGGNGSFQILVATPPTGCGPNTGPDLIVGALPTLTNFTASGGFDMFSMGTTACNIGTEVANWIDNTPDHPVIRQACYKYQVVGGAGRIEQLGMNWLKHGFGSSQDSTCCTCQPGGNFSHCGVGCSDTYASSQNAAQAGTSPNSDVNAHTGVFTYPPSNPSFSGTPARRDQIPLASLTPTAGTTHFYGEAHYVTKDDATWGNQNNNASWIEMNVSGGPSDYNFAYSGSIHTQQSAIHAWATQDPGVTFTNAQIPSDGLIIVGSHATLIAAGTWHYEYAVYNMNADRNVGSFSVPLPPGINVSAIGFHDVAYHDGDGNGSVNFSGTDWVTTQTATALTWACETEAVNTNANALRWGTTYNFRFDADVAPGTGSISFAPWKAGSPASLSAAAQVPGTGMIFAFCNASLNGVIACPCSNPSSSAGRGCDNSSATGGASITASGTASLAADTLVVTTAGETPTATSIVLQGDAFSASGVVFGQGVRCVSGNLKRLYVKTAASGSITAPAGGDPSISAQSSSLGDAIASGQHRYCMVYYRDPTVLGGCPAASTFNGTNALDVSWSP
jgi:hypothetical protein